MLFSVICKIKREKDVGNAEVPGAFSVKRVENLNHRQ
jgi:hypothetical protein